LFQQYSDNKTLLRKIYEEVNKLIKLSIHWQQSRAIKNTYVMYAFMQCMLGIYACMYA